MAKVVQIIPAVEQSVYLKIINKEDNDVLVDDVFNLLFWTLSDVGKIEGATIVWGHIYRPSEIIAEYKNGQFSIVEERYMNFSFKTREDKDHYLKLVKFEKEKKIKNLEDQIYKE